MILFYRCSESHTSYILGVLSVINDLKLLDSYFQGTYVLVVLVHMAMVCKEDRNSEKISKYERKFEKS